MKDIECSLSLVKKSIEFCSELEGKIVIVHLHANGVFFNPRDEVKVIGKIRECLNEIAIFTKKMGVQVAVENGPKVDGWSFGSNIPKILRLIEDTGNDNLGLCLDTGHIFVGEENIDLFNHCSAVWQIFNCSTHSGYRWKKGSTLGLWERNH